MEVGLQPGYQEGEYACGIRKVLTCPVSLLVETVISPLLCSSQGGSKESQPVIRTEGVHIRAANPSVVREFHHVVVDVVVPIAEDRSFIGMLD